MSITEKIKGVVIIFDIEFAVNNPYVNVANDAIELPSIDVIRVNTYKDFVVLKDSVAILRHVRIIHELLSTHPDEYRLRVDYNKIEDNQITIRIDKLYECKDKVELQPTIEVAKTSELQPWVYLERKPNGNISYHELRNGPLAKANPDIVELIDYLEERMEYNTNKGKRKQIEKQAKVQAQSTKKPTNAKPKTKSKSTKRNKPTKTGV